MANDVTSTNSSLSIIDGMNLSAVQNTMQKISDFQKIIQSTLHQGHDFGIIPGTPKPTLLKPGAEKILMMMGLRSEFEIADSTRDWQEGFFQYQVRSKLYKGDFLITEGLGACNSKEKKYLKASPYDVDNTVLKMAKKRALVDAALMVGSLSDIFTQDLDDVDLAGEQASTQSRVFTDQDGTISKAQAKRIYALAKGDAELAKGVAKKYGYNKSDEILKTDYEKICTEVEELANKASDEELPFK